MNTIGIDHNLDRARIRKLLIIGLVASAITGAGDFLPATLSDQEKFDAFEKSLV